jgi:hypothetical protein
VDAKSGRSLGRNDPCHCGSGKKYKSCCLGKDEAAARAARAKATEARSSSEETAPANAAGARAPRHDTYQPWKRLATNTQPFQRMSVPRKVGGG